MVCSHCSGQPWIGILICSYISAVCHLNPLSVSGAAFRYRNSNTTCFPIPSSKHRTWIWDLDLTSKIYQPRLWVRSRGNLRHMQERTIQGMAMTGLRAQRFERQGDRILQCVQGFMAGMMISLCGLQPSMETSVDHHHIFMRHNFAIILPIPVSCSFCKFESLAFLGVFYLSVCGEWGGRMCFN